MWCLFEYTCVVWVFPYCDVGPYSTLTLATSGSTESLTMTVSNTPSLLTSAFGYPLSKTGGFVSLTAGFDFSGVYSGSHKFILTHAKYGVARAEASANEYPWNR